MIARYQGYPTFNAFLLEKKGHFFCSGKAFFLLNIS